MLENKNVTSLSLSLFWNCFSRTIQRLLQRFDQAPANERDFQENSNLKRPMENKWKDQATEG